MYSLTFLYNVGIYLLLCYSVQSNIISSSTSTSIITNAIQKNNEYKSWVQQNTFIENNTVFTVPSGSTIRLAATSFIPLLRSNKLDICTRTSKIKQDSTRGIPSSSTLPLNSKDSNVKQIHFTDVTREAGVHGIIPQKQIKTSPNCIFDSWDMQRKIWNKGTFCMPEILTGGASTADIDNNGFEDIYVTRLDNIDSLYRNNGDGTFTDIIVESGLQSTQFIRSNAVALFDIDNDGDIDIFISTVGDKRMYLFVNDGTGYFTEQGIDRGIALLRSPKLPPSEGGLTSSFSIAIGDYDLDGYLDVYTTEWFPRLHVPDNMVNNATGVNIMTTCKLFRNQGHVKPGYFIDTTWESGIRPKVGGVSYEEEQMNIDLWFSEKYQKKLRQILQNLGLSSTVINQRIQQINNEAETMFKKEAFRNELMNKIFTKLDTVGHGSVDGRHLPYHYMEGFPYVGVFQFGARFVDLNNDNYPELLISGDFGTTQLYWNNQNGTFTLGPLHLLWDHFDNSMGASIGDINNDGKFDILFTSMALKAPTRLAIDKFYPKAGIASNFEGNHLYMNDGQRLFTDITSKAGVKDAGWAWGGILFDYDNDGNVDMAICNGMDDPETTDDDFAVNTPNVAFHNNGIQAQYSFTSVGNQLGLDDKRDGRGYFEFDYDNDGDLDLFLVNHADYPVLYRNDGGNINNYLRIKVGERSCNSLIKTNIHVDGSETDQSSDAFCIPRESIGAKVFVTIRKGDAERIREIGSAAAFMAQSELVAHFGLGNSGNEETSIVYQVRIYWPVYNATRILYNVPTRTEIQVLAPTDNNAIIETDLNLQGNKLSSCEEMSPRILRANIHSATENGKDTGQVELSSSTLILQYTAPFESNKETITNHLSLLISNPYDPSTNIPMNIVFNIQPATNIPSPEVPTSTRKYTKPLDEILAHWYVEFATPRSYQQPQYESGQAIYSEPHEVIHKVFERKSQIPNNNNFTDWGMKNTPFLRLLPPFYADSLGNQLPGNKRYKGLLNKLPSAREVSNRIMSIASYGYDKSPISASTDQPGLRNPGIVYSRPPISHLFTYFTMFLAHDMYNIYPEYWWETIDKPSIGTEHDHNIFVPKGDAVWDNDNNGNTVIPFHRSPYMYVPTEYTYKTEKSSLIHPYLPSTLNSTSTITQRYRQQINTVTHYLDMQTVYGTDPLRAGRLIHPFSPPGAGQFVLARLPNNDLIDPKFKNSESSLTSIQQSILPFDDPRVPAGNANPLRTEPQNLFLSGDNRINMHPGIVTMHTLFAREHNRLYRELGIKSEFGGINGPPIIPSNKNEPIRGMINDKNITLYAVIASIIRAQYQSIIWNEYLPVLLGYEYWSTLPKYQGYNARINPSITNEFANSAFEFYLSLLHDDIPRLLSNNKQHRKGSINMINSWYNPVSIAYEGGLDSILRGGWSSTANNVDLIITESVRNNYLGAKSKGLDLLALTIQRGRDHGLPTYQYIRQYFNLPIYTSFTDLIENSIYSPSPIKHKLKQKLQDLYINYRNSTTNNEESKTNNNNINDNKEEIEQEGLNRIDLFVGGLLEPPLPGGIVGITFGKIIAEQFLRLRDGDRFWYENLQGPMGNIINRYVSLEQIQNIRLATLINKNSGVEIIKEEINYSSQQGQIKLDNINKLDTTRPSVFYTRRK